MKTKRLAASLLALAIVAVAVTSCPNPASSSKGAVGSLSILVTNNVNAKTLLPPIDMNAASFTVSGLGPNGAAFSQTTSGGTVAVNNLAFGIWSVTVNALNAAGAIIGSGQATATVHTGEATAVSISVVPLAGNGTLSLSVTWTASQVETPSIEASLTPPSGPAATLSFSVTGAQATFSSTTIPAGYQTLTLQLLDNGIPVMGAVEVVRIVAGQATSGTYAFTNVNQPGGTLQVNITPALANPIPVSISGVGSTITAGTNIAAAASVSDGTANVIYVWYLNGVSQATGTMCTFGSTLAAGYYRLDVTAYTADGTRAGSGTASFQVREAAGPRGRYVYVPNTDSNTLSVYSIGSNGALTQLPGSPFAAGPQPWGVAVTPNGSFLYATNYFRNNVSGYSIGSNGALTQLAGSPFTAGSVPYEVAVTPNGSFLYVTNATSSNISAYSIGLSGALTQLTGSPFAAGTFPYGVAISPNGSFLYAANENGNNISAYSIGSNGALTQLTGSPFACGAEPYGVAVSPNGSFLYVANGLGNNVSAYSIASNGAITQLTGSPFAAGSVPYGVAVSPNGSFLYVTNMSSSNVSAYSIGPNGTLTQLAGSPFAVGAFPFGIAVSPNGSFLYVVNEGDCTVSAYAIDLYGALTQLTGSPFAAGSAPTGIAIAP